MSKALITGASRGIGLAIKNLFEENCIDVYAPTRAEMDLSDNNSIRKYVKNLEYVDILVNCAGVNNLASIPEITDSALQDMLQVNLIAQTVLIQELSVKMKEHRYGRIVNFSSIWSEFSKERRIMYSMAKSGVNGLTTAAAVELAQYNVLVNAIAPGFVNTEMTSKNNTPQQINDLAAALPLKRLAEPKEIAELVLFLTSEKNSFITGQTIFADGGFSCV